MADRRTHRISRYKKKERFSIAQELGDQRAPTTIHEAAEKGLSKDIARLVERSMEAVDLDARDRYGRTALMWAADIGSCPAAEVLLELGADRRAGDPLSGRNPLHLAARTGNAAMLAQLVAGMEKSDVAEYVNEADSNGITPLFLAKQKGEEGLAAFQLLMECGARYNQQAWRNLGALPPPMPPGHLSSPLP